MKISFLFGKKKKIYYNTKNNHFLMKKIFLILCLIFSVFFMTENLFAVTNVNIGSTVWENESAASNNLDKLDDFWEVTSSWPEGFVDISRWGTEAIYYTLLQIARDIKNLFYAIATVYFLIISLQLIFASNTEEAIWKFKKGIIWITLWLILMQLALAFAEILFDRGVSAGLAINFFENLVLPMIDLVRLLASVFFIAMAFYAFYRLITANGNEEAVKSGKMTIVYALIGFILVKIAQIIVEAFYGRVGCSWIITGCSGAVDVSAWAGIILRIIQWLNGFVAIVVLIMILYAGVQILLSGWDEEKVKKGKTAIFYVALWLFILVINFLILTFFFRPESVI